MADRFRPRRGPREIAAMTGFYALLSAAAFVAALPFLYMIANALKTYAETVTRISANPLSAEFWPSRPEWANFAEVWVGQDFGRYFLNSVVIALVSVSGTVATSSLAAYSFAKLEFVGKKNLFSILILTLMIPETATLVPNFLVVSRLGWMDTLPALTVPFMASAFDIFMLRQFFAQVPNSIVEAAKMDGCSHLRVLLSIFFPLSRGPLFTVAFLAVMTSWNSLQWPLVVTQTPRWRPISVGLARFITEAGPETHLRLAGAIIALAPIVAVYLSAQKQITEAIASTGMKE
jgi:ABC-type glycerol-3-phosphate transport system permease component